MEARIHRIDKWITDHLSKEEKRCQDLCQLYDDLLREVKDERQKRFEKLKQEIREKHQILKQKRSSTESSRRH